MLIVLGALGTQLKSFKSHVPNGTQRTEIDFNASL